MRLADAVNPFRKVNPSTELQCAVIRLPLAGGVAHVDRSIAIETREIDASMSGTLDFRNETLDLSIRPRVRQGIPIEIPQIAELVRFRGPFTAPTVNVDAVASATAIARIGAAIGTGGLSVLGESILAQVGASTGTGACERCARQDGIGNHECSRGSGEVRCSGEPDRGHRQRPEGTLPALTGPPRPSPRTGARAVEAVAG